MNQTFLIVYRPGAAWVPGQPVRAQPPAAHGPYLLALYRQGSLRFAGPFADDSGAALVLEAPDEAQARALVEHDPAVSQAVFTYELYPWVLVPLDRYILEAKAQ